jgi:hypothetical protein
VPTVLLAELEVRHSRAIAPTRRVALGELYLPTDPPPGDAGLLLAAILAACCARLDDEQCAELEVLLDDLERGRRIVQPRLRHRFQSDTHGLDRSRHRLVRDDDGRLHFELDDHGALLPQALAALYAAGRLSYRARPDVFRLLRRATRWQGDVDDRLLHYLSSDEAPSRRPVFRGDEQWALAVLGFVGGGEPGRSEILRRFRLLVRDAHPDHGADAADAGRRITELTEAKRILLVG